MDIQSAAAGGISYRESLSMSQAAAAATYSFLVGNGWASFIMISNSSHSGGGGSKGQCKMVMNYCLLKAPFSFAYSQRLYRVRAVTHKHIEKTCWVSEEEEAGLRRKTKTRLFTNTVLWRYPSRASARFSKAKLQIVSFLVCGLVEGVSRRTEQEFFFPL